ncbi:P-loop containing nucleoside triphosphate hydrolase protein [Spinellus fusiger]|nr:P-loop containing nucleoside triphosphate hydrolase protein [Spinellus fusiger]
MSSLFSSNPEIKPLPKTFKKTHRNQTPSNAPVADNTTFTGIGIDVDLVQLLSTKFSVKTPTNVQRKAIPLLLGPSRTVIEAEIPQQDVDIVVQAETGSGKTLTYLLPIVNRLVAASTFNLSDGDTTAFGDRSIGTVAIILTPTRELAQQVEGVLATLVNLPKSNNAETRRLHWIVPGTIIGGDSKSKEKARLRKGVNVLVSTPGRLLDHLENTKSFNVQNLRWLVLDEADRLLDLGFEETLKKIMALIDERTKTGVHAKFSKATNTKYWPKRRQTVLCSATLREDVKNLVGWSLINPVFVSGTQTLREGVPTQDGESMPENEVRFTTPNQLKQTYIVTPAKLRLITLTALLKSLNQKKKGSTVCSKTVVFFSCCDSVDFHYDLFANTGRVEEVVEVEDNGESDEMKLMHQTIEKIVGKEGAKHAKHHQKGPTKSELKSKKDKRTEQLKLSSQISSLLGDVPVFRLHGDLDQKIRSQTFLEFGKASRGVLFCTDIAARGLDLPNVDRIIQYDPPSDIKEYVHRVGRTARLGKAGGASLFLMPNEIEYLDILKAQEFTPEPIEMGSILSVLADGPKGSYQIPAQEIQNEMERYTVADEERVMLARKAYWSSVRAYATHCAAEKHIFHIKNLHLGHLAKSFALREAPSALHEQSKGRKKKEAKKERMPGQHKFAGKEGVHRKNPLKRDYDHASEFAIASASDMVAGPVTKKKRNA